MTSQDSAEVEVKKQVAALISQIKSIESDESPETKEETEEQFDQLLALSFDVQRLAKVLVYSDRQLAKELLSSYVNATPWFEADYGPDGFYSEHEVCSDLLFNLGKNWPKDLIPESFDSEKGDFSFCAGLSMNPSLTVDKLGRFRASAINYGYGWDEDVVLGVALLLNPNSTYEFVLKAIEQLSGDELDWLLGLIIGNHVTFGYSSEYAQELIMDSAYSADALKAIKHCVESDKTGAFNQICFTDEGARFVSPNPVLEAIDLRLASKNPPQQKRSSPNNSGAFGK
jgi:uncharacterized protein (UPF0335 family)